MKVVIKKHKISCNRAENLSRDLTDTEDRKPESNWVATIANTFLCFLMIKLRSFRNLLLLDSTIDIHTVAKATWSGQASVDVVFKKKNPQTDVRLSSSFCHL